MWSTKDSLYSSYIPSWILFPFYVDLPLWPTFSYLITTVYVNYILIKLKKILGSQSSSLPSQCPCQLSSWPGLQFLKLVSYSVPSTHLFPGSFNITEGHPGVLETYVPGWNSGVKEGQWWLLPMLGVLNFSCSLNWVISVGI